MATTCNTNQYITNGACLTTQTITPAQQKAILLYAKSLLLSAVGGTNYAGLLSTTMLTDASQIACGMTRPQVEAAKVALWLSAAGEFNAFAAGISSWMTAIKCLEHADPDVMEKADLMLTCKILSQMGY